MPTYTYASLSQAEVFFPQGNVRVWLCTQPTDMRKSYNGLVAMVKHQLHDNPLSGHLYVFINRRRTLMKILYFDRNGYAIWSKRLEQGQFVIRQSSSGKRELSFTQLQCLLDGIELNNTRHYKRFSLPNQTSV